MYLDWPMRDSFDEIEKAERKRKKIDRIQRRAEAAQRYQKRGSWK